MWMIARARKCAEKESRRVKTAMAIGAAGLVAAVALASVTAVSSRAATEKATGASDTYYYINQDLSLPIFQKNDIPALKLAAKQLHVNLKITGPSAVDYPSYIATIDQVCALHPAGVLVTGWDPTITAPVNQCAKEGVPTVVVDADLPGSKEWAFVGSNWTTLGTVLGQQLCLALPHGGTVATLSLFNAANMTAARNGFAAVVKKCGIKIVANQDDTKNDPAIASALLAGHPHLSALAGFDSYSGQEIVTALRETHKLGKVKVVTNESQTPGFLTNVKAGYVQAVTIQKRALFGYYGLFLLWAYHHSGLQVEKIPPTLPGALNIPYNIDTGVVTVTKANVASVMKAQGTK